MFVPVIFMNALAKTGSYSATVLSLSPILYYPMLESSGTNAENLGSVASGDGTYDGVTLASVAGPMTGELAPLSDGANDNLDIYSANFNTAFDGNEGSISGWFKVANAGVWTDTTSRFLVRLFVDANNRIEVQRTGTNNEMRFRREAAGDDDQLDVATFAGSTAWHHFLFTWSDTAEAHNVYIDGVAETPIATIGTFVGNLDANGTAIFSSGVNLTVWSGYAAHIAIFDSVLTQANATLLATAV